MESVALNGGERSRLERIRDAILGIAFRMKSSVPYIPPFLDYLLLLFQKPGIGLSLHDADGNRLFSSGKCAGTDSIDIARLRREGICLSMDPGAKDPVGPWLLIHDAAEGSDHSRNKALLEKLLRDDSLEPKLGRAFFEEELGPALQSLQNPVKSDTDSRGKASKKDEAAQWPDFNHNDIDNLLAPIRHLLDSALADAGHSTRLLAPADRSDQSSKARPDLLNVFTGVKIAQSETRENGSHYTARLVFSEGQRMAIQARLIAFGGLKETGFDNFKDFMAALETRTGYKSSTIAEHCFTYGTTAFGTIGDCEEDSAREAEDRARQKAERLLYKLVVNEERPSGFFIPIHVGRSPWLVIYTLSKNIPTPENGGWHHNYMFYREVSTKLASQIRTIAKQAYVKNLASTFSTALGEVRNSQDKNPSALLVRTVNSMWARLAHVYPLALFQMRESKEEVAEKEEFSLFVRGLPELQVLRTRNPFFHDPGDADFGDVHTADVEQACMAVLDKNVSEAKIEEQLQERKKIFAQYGIRSDAKFPNPKPFAKVMAGGSLQMQCIHYLIERFSDPVSKVETILISGEPGTGKELVANLIEERRKKHFRAVDPADPAKGIPGWNTYDRNELHSINCASFSGNHELAEGRLFGYQKGAFTDAKADSYGIFRGDPQAVVFLDEIHHMSLDTQAKLLRLIEAHEIIPLGRGVRSIKWQGLLVLATNRDLKTLVAERKFLPDLYDRISSIQIPLPPLHERPLQDFRDILDHLKDSLAITIAKEGEELLLCHTWEGNVRALKKVLAGAKARIEPGSSGIIPMEDVVFMLKQLNARPKASYYEIHASSPKSQEKGNEPENPKPPKIKRPTYDKKTWPEGLMQAFFQRASEIVESAVDGLAGSKSDGFILRGIEDVIRQLPPSLEKKPVPGTFYLFLRSHRNALKSAYTEMTRSYSKKVSQLVASELESYYSKPQASTIVAAKADSASI
jgi:DNA-binding NtrC family response regulator